MAISSRFLLAGVLLLLAIISITYEGASAQIVECAKRQYNCLSNYTKDENCKSAQTYLSCIDKARQDCDLDQAVMDKAKERVAKLKCSGAGLPVISFICLLMAAIFHMSI